MAVSYSDTLAKTHANDFRRVVNDPLYQATFPAMRPKRDTDREITTTKRGRRYATSIEGTLTGLGGNLIIIDDPIKLGDAQSEAVRQRTLEWYRSTLVTRTDDKRAARIVLMMQRVHEGDLAGYLQEQGGFEVLNLPAIAQAESKYDLGHGRTYLRRKGELLHPEHEPTSVLLVLRGRFPFEVLKQKILDTKQRYGRGELLIEESPISLGLMQSIREKYINVTPYRPDRDKRARLITQNDLFAGGSIRLPERAPWLEAFVAELLAFPGRHDDQVDALTQGLAWGANFGTR